MRKMLPPSVVVGVIILLAFSAAGYFFGVRESFEFKALRPNPSSVTQGSTPSDVFLQINFTSPGTGNFTYIVTYNTSHGEEIAGEGNILVSHLSPATAYFYIPLNGDPVIVQAEVFKGAATSQNLVFSKNVTL